MKRLRISMRQITFILVVIVLPLTALVCNQSPPRLQGNETSTPSPAPALPIATSTSTGGNYSLQASWEGSYSLPNGLITATYGPDAVTIPLQSSGDTYVGSLEAVWHAGVTGACTATGSPPVSFDVIAKKDASGDFDFTVDRSIVWTWDTVCPGVSGGATSAKQTYTYTFILPAEEGASKTFNPGGPTWTFTLRKPGP